MSNDIKRIDIREFRETGYLQELNRLFLHPLGLALEVIIDDDGSERLGGIWDYRADDEGIAYSDATDLAEKADRVAGLQAERGPRRMTALGYIIQPPLATP